SDGSDPLAELSERGRGLLLVDHFASVWGTTHQGTRKGVWFRLDRDNRRGASAATTPGDPRPVRPAPPAGLDAGLLSARTTPGGTADAAAGAALPGAPPDPTGAGALQPGAPPPPG